MLIVSQRSYCCAGIKYFWPKQDDGWISIGEGCKSVFRLEWNGPMEFLACKIFLNFHFLRFLDRLNLKKCPPTRKHCLAGILNPFLKAAGVRGDKKLALALKIGILKEDHEILRRQSLGAQGQKSIKIKD